MILFLPALCKSAFDLIGDAKFGIAIPNVALGVIPASVLLPRIDR
jgi:hypothetical protein